MSIYIFLGTAGSGKGTQAKALSQIENIVHISTGDLLRLSVEKKTKLGEKVKKVLAEGKLVTDDLVNGMISDFFIESYALDKTYILDGYPRTIDQALFFKDLVKKKHLRFKKVIFFELSKEHAVKRISGRLLCPKTNKIYHKILNPPPKELEHTLIQRSDDSPENAVNRFELFENETKPILDLFAQELIRIDASQQINEILQQLKQVFVK